MAGDPHVGTWKLNPAKSKYNPGPPPKSFTVQIQAQDNSLKYVFAGVGAEGKTFHDEATSKFDGKDYPFMSSYANAIVSRRINANTVEFVTKKSGKEVSRWREVISKDGKTITATEKGKDEKGKDFNRAEVFDKQ